MLPGLFRVVGKLVALFPQPLCPLRLCPGSIEVLIWDWFAYAYAEMFAAGSLHHLPWQQDEADVELHVQFAPQPFEGVEGNGVASFEIHGHYVALRFYALLYYALLPLYVLYASVNVSRAETCRETDELCAGIVVGLLQFFYVHALLPAHGVHGQEYALQGFYVHEQVVDDDLYLGEEVTEYRYVGYAVECSQGMVAHQHVVPRAVKVVHALHGVCHVQVMGHGLGKGSPLVVPQACEYVIHLPLADEPFHHANDPCGEFLAQFGRLARDYGFEVYQLHG